MLLRRAHAVVDVLVMAEQLELTPTIHLLAQPVFLVELEYWLEHCPAHCLEHWARPGLVRLAGLHLDFALDLTLT